MKILKVKNVSLSYKTIEKNDFKALFSLKKVTTFQALKNISFSLEKGEVLGIIGQNVSGKSTLLKTIANVFSPNEGTIEIANNLKVGLLSLGTGFDNKLTGYENIYLSGMLYGYNKAYIDSKLSQIIEFSELEDFIYKPVSTYSSGMYSKLSFSIAVFLEVDILLIDEVLSVGDIHFKEKSYNKITELIKKEDKTVIVVSHSTSMIEELCSRVIWLHDGKVKMQGETTEVIKQYTKFMKNLKK